MQIIKAFGIIVVKANKRGDLLIKKFRRISTQAERFIAGAEGIENGIVEDVFHRTKILVLLMHVFVEEIQWQSMLLLF